MRQQQQGDENDEQRMRRFYGALRSYLRTHGRVRNQEAVSLLRVGSKKSDIRSIKNGSRGILAKLVEMGFLAAISDSNEVVWYYSNQENFYSPRRLAEMLLPKGECDRITSHIKEHPLTIQELSWAVYGDPEGMRGANLIATMLKYYISRGAIELAGGKYRRTVIAEHFGLNADALPLLDAAALENRVFARKEDKGAKIETMDDLVRVMRKDRMDKTVHPLDITDMLADPDHFTIGLSAEHRIGDQNFDAENFQAWLQRGVPGRGQFDAIVLSGLTAGGFNTVGQKRKLTLTEGLRATKHQFKGAGAVLNEAEQSTAGPCLVMLGDDDQKIAWDDAVIHQLAMGKGIMFGVDQRGLSFEKERRLRFAHLLKRFGLNYQTLVKYQYLIGRGLLDDKEVDEAIGEEAYEYFLTLRILLALRSNLPYDKRYEQVVNVEALTKDRLGRRIVTPNSLILKINKREMFQLVHNTNFSEVTQYQRPDAVLEAMVSRLGALGVTPPKFLVDCQQEMLQAHCEHGSWFVTLGGNSNPSLAARFRMPEINQSPLDSKARRQIRVRKIAPTPSNIAIEKMPDGRVRFHFHNPKIEEMMKRQENKPEETHVLVLLGDEQTGSPTMETELVMKFLDWALYDGDGLPTTELWHNGDAIQGSTIYQSFVKECKGIRLLDIDGQQIFYGLTHFPLFKSAPALRGIYATPGNHEYDNRGARMDGVNYLRFLQTELTQWIEGMRSIGKEPTLREVRVADRDRWLRTSNPENDMFQAPFIFRNYLGEVGAPDGIGVAMIHTWALRHRSKGVGGPPIYEQRQWHRKMGAAAAHINISIGGDKHSLWFGEENNKLMFQCAPAASQSGLEVQLGLMSQVAFQRLVISNRLGIFYEVIPWTMLMEHRCQSPFLRGKDKELERPKPGTRDYDLGKFSPLVEHFIDETIVYSNTRKDPPHRGGGGAVMNNGSTNNGPAVQEKYCDGCSLRVAPGDRDAITVDGQWYHSHGCYAVKQDRDQRLAAGKKAEEILRQAETAAAPRKREVRVQ
jgi:hypothetical protein